MELRGRTILVLGGAGLVGKAVCRRLIKEHPAHLIVGAVRQSRVENAATELRAEAPEGTRISGC